MDWEIISRYIHFISIITVASALVSEHLLIQPMLTRQEIKRLSVIDAIYGVGAISLVAAGLALWLWVGKPAAHYSGNPIFHFKLLLAILMGIISIWPTVWFIRNRKGPSDEIIAVPKWIKILVRIELLIIFTIPLLASLMAKGIGLY